MSQEKKSNFLKNDEGNPELELLIGIVLLAAGLFMLSKRVIVHTGWYMWRIGNFNLSSGTVIIPLLIGIIWYFYNPKSFMSKAIIGLSIVFIVISIIMSVSLNFMATSMFDYVLILGMSAAGFGLILKGHFGRKNKN